MAEKSVQSGYWMPEEGEPHERTFMQWPVNRQVHDDPVFLKMLQRSIAEIANTISEFEPVIMLMDQQFKLQARKLLSQKVEIWAVPTDDLWARDSGPVFVVNKAGELAISHLNFNGWGNRQVHDNDGEVASRVAERMGLPLLDNGLVGEAGGVESDGDGTLIAHESSWVNPNRNRQSKSVVEAKMLQAFGASKLIWAPGIRDGDITDYHIDALARFVAPGKVLIQLPEKRDETDEWAVAAYQTFDILNNATDAKGRKLELVTVSEPGSPRITSSVFVASYVNYYVCNGAVIAAQFGDEDTDAEATSILRKQYPDREIMMLNVDPIGEVGGGIHCATQQQPKV